MRHTRVLMIVAVGIFLTLGAATAMRAEARGPAERAIPRLVLFDPAAPHPVTPKCGSRRGAVVPMADPGLTEGDWLYFDQAPAILGPDWKGPLEARNFTVLGDVPQIALSLVDGGPEHVFERRDLLTIDGDEVSVFDLLFPKEEFRKLPREYRFDRSDTIRIRPSTLPKTKVVRIDDRVQYSSHVVNIVHPWPGAEMYALPVREIGEVFYEHFSDTYEELAFVPVRRYQSPQWGAYHHHVRNEVGGINFREIDESAQWQGSEALLAYIVLYRGEIEWNYLSLHETAHQWGFFWNLFEAAGVSPQGSTACAGSNHVPLVADQPSFLSYCLLPPLRIENKQGRWRVGDGPTPLFFHPFQLYAMGLMDPDEVPPLMLARKQGSLGSPPRAGKRVKGPFVEVTVEDVIARYGERTGPVAPSVWRRAYVVVTPDRLLSKKELRWYNLIAKRVSDPDVTGVEGVDRIPSLEIATAGAMDLQTEIRPRSRSRVRGNFEATYPKIGRGDIPGIVFDKKLPTHFLKGRTYVLSGKVNRAPYFRVTIEVGEKSFSAPLGDGLRFSVALTLGPEDRGPRTMTLWLGDKEVEIGSVAPVYVE